MFSFICGRTYNKTIKCDTLSIKYVWLITLNSLSSYKLNDCVKKIFYYFNSPNQLKSTGEKFQETGKLSLPETRILSIF